MNQEKIHERQGNHNHDGRHSTQRRLDSAIASLKAWKAEGEQRLGEVIRYPINLKADNERRQRIAGHETGNIDEIPESEEIVLFDIKSQNITI